MDRGSPGLVLQHRLRLGFIQFLHFLSSTIHHTKYSDFQPTNIHHNSYLKICDIVTAASFDAADEISMSQSLPKLYFCSLNCLLLTTQVFDKKKWLKFKVSLSFHETFTACSVGKFVNRNIFSK